MADALLARPGSTAVLSPCGTYRYSLTRNWDSDGPRLLFVMLNPSTADADRDDQTIKRCMFYAQRDGYGSIEVVNLFAYRTVSPAVLKRAYRQGVDIIGRANDENDNAIKDAFIRAAQVVVAWGAHGGFTEGREFALRMMLEGWQPLCLGHTANASPRHPSRLSNDQQFVPWLVIA